MFKWIRDYREANRQTKFFYLTLAIYGIVILLTTLYAYAKLHVETNYNPPTLKTENPKDKLK